ncbi:uncharacterized protein K444DRAFT_21565 [Hyaloscypha bicolor E]|uniref:Uncharacterized protein n=1 Tax=Hyaloscypha bicolor E TaxID=1095630 RepID=A0A2J6T4J6_9HELO|nr:uncharacterized protein K444DRAFT_21565 [Hyaloscypha bicolor E]PMD57939.1 hypothetical protein K444DRAFT_21565 [Hyaloscypha bicolor E]
MRAYLAGETLSLYHNAGPALECSCLRVRWYSIVQKLGTSELFERTRVMNCDDCFTAFRFFYSVTMSRL